MLKHRKIAAAQAEFVILSAFQRQDALPCVKGFGMEIIMERIDELKEEIKEAILTSDEYKEYKKLDNYIKTKPDLKRAVDEFRRENFRLQYSDDVEDVLSATGDLNRRFEDVRQQTMVNRYLTAEMCLCRMVQDVCLSIVEAIDFDMDFLQ